MYEMHKPPQNNNRIQGGFRRDQSAPTAERRQEPTSPAQAHPRLIECVCFPGVCFALSASGWPYIPAREEGLENLDATKTPRKSRSPFAQTENRLAIDTVGIG